MGVLTLKLFTLVIYAVVFEANVTDINAKPCLIFGA
jgi:hypothetical protein